MKKILLLLILPLLVGLSCENKTNNIVLEDKITLNNFQLLQGSWISDDDQNSIINFVDYTKSDIYEGVVLEKNNFKLYDHLPITDTSQENKNGQYLIVDSLEENVEYQISELSEKTLSLIYLIRGNSLKYSR